MKIIVSGATSFLGEAFVRAATEHGHTVVALVRRRTTTIEELTDEIIVIDDLRSIDSRHLPTDVGAVVHFATGTDGNAEAMVDVATVGSIALLRAAIEVRCLRFVHVSSMSVYPGRPDVDLSRPDGRALEPYPARRGAYAWSKIAAEVALAAEEIGALHMDIVRPGLVFGSRMQGPLAGTAVRLPLGAVVATGRAGQHVPLVTIDDVNQRLLAMLDEQVAPGTTEIHDILSATPTKAELLNSYRRLTGQARHVIWLPTVIAVGGARLIDGVRRSRGAPSNLGYAMRRLYEFDARNIGADELAASVPAESQVLRDALDTSITLNPDGDGETLRVRAGEFVDVWRSPAPEAPVRIVLVGAGRIVSEMHLAAITTLPSTTVAAVVDRDLAAAKSVALPLGAVAASELEDLPSSVMEDAVVVVATPGGTHHDLVLQAVRYGATAIVEKPVVLSVEQLDSIVEAGSNTAIDVFHNYRLRPAVLAFWRFLIEHDVGPIRRAGVTFHSPRIETERARWLRDEIRSRALVVELGVHFLDLAFLIAGPLQTIRDLDVNLDPRGGGLIRAAGGLETSSGARIDFDLDISGVAQRTQLVLAFERATCVLDFFPDGFRVLPPRSNPIDDVAAATGRLGSALFQRVRPRVDGVQRRVLPHAAIYRAHLRSRASGTPSPFAATAIEPSMRSILELAHALYDPLAAL